MEQRWALKTDDGFVIHGLKNVSDQAAPPARRAIFICHGLTGHMYEYAIKCAADHFQNDFDVYRFNFYDGEEGARSLIDCTIQTHADDLNRVLDKFGGGYDQIYLIGHSYGGPTIMLANPDHIMAVSLWDPSYDLRQIQQEFSERYIEHLDYYVVNWGTSYLISKDMYNEAGQLDQNACADLAQKFNAPVQVIHAGNGLYCTQPQSYHSYGKAENIALNQRHIVPGTEHCFYEGDSCKELLSKTEQWFKGFYKKA